MLLAAVALPQGAARAADQPGGTAFDASTVRNLARELAGKPYKPPSAALPDSFAKLTYDQYRAIRFDPDNPRLVVVDEPARD